MTHRVLVIMGVSGCGKSTIAQGLVDRLGWDFAEGDAFHSAANVAKMTDGHPLTDTDRWPWLESIAAWIGDHIDAGRPGVVTCSALKRSYRDVLRRGSAARSEGGAGADHLWFVHLEGTRELIAGRLADRHGHYMPASLLDSQFATLEAPGPDEQVLRVDIAPPAAQQVEAIIDQLRLSPLGADAHG